MEFLLQLGKFFLFTLLSELLRPKQPVTRNPAGSLKDISFPTVEPTRPHQWLIGRRLIDNANVFGTFDFQGVERSKKVRTGLISSQEQPLPPIYYISAAMILCGGAGARLKQIFVGDRLAWTGDADSGAQIPINLVFNQEGREEYPEGIQGTLEFYSGSTTPSAYLEQKRGVGNVPAWPHLTYVVLRGTDGSGRPGAWIGTNKIVGHLKLVVERMPTAASTRVGASPDGGNYWTVDGDANLSYALAEVLTDRHYGAGLAPETLNSASFHTSAKTLFLENHGTSQLWDSQRVSGDVAIELCRQAGMIIQPDSVTGLQTLRLFRETDTPVLVLDDTNIKRVDQFSRSAMDEATNAMSLQYTARDEKYEQRPVEVQDLAAIEVAGQVISGTASYAGITNATVASTLALRDLRAISAPLASARVSAIVPKRQRFMPGDTVLFSSAKHGVLSLRMRITSARYSRPGEALCELELIEDVFRSGEAVYGVPAIVGATGGLMLPPAAPTGGILVRAPRALSKDIADHMLYAVTATNVADTLVDIGWSAINSSTYPSSLEYASRGANYRHAVAATLSAQLDWSATGSRDVTLTAANRAVLLAALGGFSLGIPAVIHNFISSTSDDMFVSEHEFVTVTAVSITGPTTAMLTITNRGIYDTWPQRWPAGSKLVLLTDYALDPAPLATSIASTVDYSGGPAVREVTGLTFSRVFAKTKNVAGVSATGASTFLASWSGDNYREGRALRPAVPGAVKFDGKLGAYSLTDAVPEVSKTGRSAIALTWSDRGYGESSKSWFNADKTSVAGMKAVYKIWSSNDDGATWTDVYSGRVDASLQTIDVPALVLTVGRLHKIVVQIVEPVTPTVDIWPAVGGSDLVASISNPGRHFLWKVLT